MAAPLFDLRPRDKLLELVFDQLKIIFPMEEFADKHNGKKANQKFSSNKKKTASTAELRYVEVFGTQKNTST